MKQVPWWSNSFDNGEAEAVRKAVTSKNLSQGPIVLEFERQIGQFLKTGSVIATTSGTDALVLSLTALGIGQGDEVLVPDRTWIATAHAVHAVGATPVFIEVEPKRPVIDMTSLGESLTPRTKAVITVHMNGRDAHSQELESFCAGHGLLMLEDAAQALGASNARGFLGCQSVAGIFSLSVAKVIASGQGGFVVTNDDELAERLRAIRTHGVENVLTAKWQMAGLNFRFTDVLASIALVQLALLPERLDRLREIYRRYARGLADIGAVALIEEDLDAGEIGPYIEVLVENRATWVKELADRGIETREFYPQLRVANYWRPPSRPYSSTFENSDKFATMGLYLPSGPSLTDPQIDRTLAALHEVSRKLGS